MEDKLNYRIDIDNTICKTFGGNYEESIPYKERIEFVNSLYKRGCKIIIETGRHWNHLNMTLNQLKKWGVKYHCLIMGKLSCIIVDDMSIHPDEFFGNKEQ